MNTKLEMMQEVSIAINVLTLCQGFKFHALSYEDFKNYRLLKYLSESEALKAVDLGLFDARDKIDLEEKIAALLSGADKDVLLKEMEKWLYIRLKELRGCSIDDVEILNKIAEIYADFDYPPFMQHFVNYMPSDVDLSGYTVEQAQVRLINLCDTFVNDLESKLRNR